MKITIYLPDALRAEMDKHHGVNWSAIAQEAFASYIGVEFEPRKAATVGGVQVLGLAGPCKARQGSPRHG